jgi:hypothetical protein
LITSSLDSSVTDILRVWLLAASPNQDARYILGDSVPLASFNQRCFFRFSEFSNEDFDGFPQNRNVYSGKLKLEEPESHKPLRTMLQPNPAGRPRMGAGTSGDLRRDF